MSKGSGKKQQLAQFSRDAEVKAESFDVDGNTVEIVWTTGASVRRFSWLDGEEYDEVLSLEPGAVRLDRLNLGAPFLDTHCSWSLENVIGSVVPGTATIGDGRGTATIKLSKAPGVADTVQKIREGVIRNISVGYWIHKVVKTEADDSTVARWDVVDWEPLEVSAVPIPADPGSQIRSESAARDGSGPATRSCTFITRKPPAAAPTQESRMATRKPAAATRGKNKTVAELTAENERLSALLAAKRDEDEKDDERDEEDEDKKDSDDERDEDGGEDEDEDKKDSDDDPEDQRDDDSDDERDDEDEKRAASSAKSVRAAAQAAVKAERVRSSEITEIAERAGLPKLGRKHVSAGTSVRAFKNILLERMLAKQEKDAPIRGLSADEDVVRARGAGRSGGSEARQIAEGTAHWRSVAKLSGKSERKTDTTIAAS